MDGDLHARLKSRASGIGVGIFAAPAGAIAEAVGQLASAQVLHFDVMDGVWVPQVTGGPAFVAAFAGRYLCDVHLMVADPAAQVAAFAEAGADILTIHAEAEGAAEALARVRAASARLGRPILAGLAILPGTDPETLADLLDLRPDLILVVALDPRDGTPADVGAAARRLADLRARTAEFAPVMALDGGITEATIPTAALAGPDLVVSGSAIFKAADPAATLARLEAARRAGALAREGGDVR